MSWYTVVGSRIYVQSALGSDIAVSAMTNAAPPQAATGASHGLVDDDEVLISASDWEEFAGSVSRVDSTGATTLLLRGLDGTNADWYPTAQSTATLNKITSWLQIGQVVGISGGGGGPREVEARPFDRRTPVKQTVGFESSTVTLEIGFDPALAAQVELLAASRALGKRSLKFALPGSSYLYCYGTVALNPLPTFAADAFMTRQCAVNVDGLVTFV